MKMKAALKTVAGDFEVREVDVPELDRDEVLVRVRSSGICGSDLRSWRIPVEELSGRTTGHELAGEVVELGPDAVGRVGDRVGVEPLVGCGECYWCRIGQYNLCPELSRLRQVFTGFAEYSKSPARKIYELPSNITYDEAALLDCLSVGVHAVKQARVRVGANVGVVGDGPIGLCVVAVAAAAGANVSCVGHHDSRLGVAGEVGAREVINSREEDPLRAIESTDGIGFDAAIETVGRDAETVQLGLRLVRRGGVVAVVGSFSGSKAIDLSDVRRQEKELVGVSSYAYWGNVPEFSIALDLLTSGRVNIKPLITHHFPLEMINEAFETAVNRANSNALKVLVTP